MVDIPDELSFEVATNKAKVMIYIDPELKEKLEKLAEANNRSMSNFLETVIKDLVEAAESEGKI